jgi:putative phosphoribosyl transferase
VPVAAEVASELAVRLDVLMVRKIGVPWNPEYALGAIANGGMLVLDTATMQELGLTREGIDLVVQAERRELARRERVFRGNSPFPSLEGKVVILVDDGLATGATMRSAVEAVRTRGPALIVVAVPITSRSAYLTLDRIVDRIVCLATPEPFYAVGEWYDDFSQTTDEEVLSLLSHSEQPLLR